METIEFSSKIKNGIIRIPQKYKDIENVNVRINISYQDLFDDENNLDKIRISVKKEIVNSFGVGYIKDFIEKQLQFLYIEQIKHGIDESIAESPVDNYSLLEKVRASAWEVYKDGFLKDVKTD